MVRSKEVPSVRKFKKRAKKGQNIYTDKFASLLRSRTGVGNRILPAFRSDFYRYNKNFALLRGTEEGGDHLGELFPEVLFNNRLSEQKAAR